MQRSETGHVRTALLTPRVSLKHQCFSDSSCRHSPSSRLKAVYSTRGGRAVPCLTNSARRGLSRRIAFLGSLWRLSGLPLVVCMFRMLALRKGLHSVGLSPHVRVPEWLEMNHTRLPVSGFAGIPFWVGSSSTRFLIMSISSFA